MIAMDTLDVEQQRNGWLISPVKTNWFSYSDVLKVRQKQEIVKLCNV